MTDHSVFYYPYAFFSNDQLPLLKASALYFDKIYLLDPLKANFQGGVIDATSEGKSGFFNRIKNRLSSRGHSDEHFQGDPADELIEAIRILEKEESILERIQPEQILNNREKEIAEAILLDMSDPEFINECRASGVKRWTLALAKVPISIQNDPRYKPIDDSMRNIMGKYIEGKGYVEDRLGAGNVEYRIGDYPIELGESIMMNHALYGGLLHKGSIPFTDDYFHSNILNLKIRKAASLPQVKQILQNKEKMRQLKTNQLAITTLTDINLAIIPTELSMRKIIEYRHDHERELTEARGELANLARTIKDTPWSKEFADELETKIIPSLYPILSRCKGSQDSWLQRHRNELLKIGASTASVTASLTVTGGIPTDIPMLITAGSTIAGSTIDILEEKNLQNGFHYFMKIK